MKDSRCGSRNESATRQNGAEIYIQTKHYCNTENYFWYQDNQSHKLRPNHALPPKGKAWRVNELTE
jgi:hypothetical protein